MSLQCYVLVRSVHIYAFSLAVSMIQLHMLHSKLLSVDGIPANRAVFALVERIDPRYVLCIKHEVVQRCV